MPRLLILCEYPTLLGGERSMLATLNTVRAAGFDVVVAAPPTGPLAAELHKQGVAHVAWSTHEASNVRLPLAELRESFSALISSSRPQLVHANSLSTSRIAGPAVANRNIPSIGHLRDISRLSPQAVADVNANGRLLAVSQATRDFHVSQGLDASKCVVVHNGVDLSAFQPRPATRFLHRELGMPAQTRLVVTIGQLGLRKGTDVTLAAAAQVAAELPDVHWLVIGERTSNKTESHEFEQRLHEFAGRTPLAGRVHFLGTRDDVATILSECHVLVHAARQEPLGRVLLEAAASGVAVIATDVGGTREIFPSEADAAVLVLPDDCHGLALALRQLLQDEYGRKSLAQNARQRMEVAFDIRAAAARLICEYQSLLATTG